MNEPDQTDQWRALQIELGLLSAEETTAAASRAEPKPPAAKKPTPPAFTDEVPAPVARAAPPAEEMPEVTEEVPAFDDVSTGEIPAESMDATSDSHVEVGEAPEEVESEPPAPEEEKRRRGRRRRRRGRKPEGEGPGTAEANGAPEPAGEAGLPEFGELDDDADSAADADEEDGEEDVEPISFADFNVPTWQELIASLYRPER